MASDLVKAVRSQKNLERAWSVIQQNGRTSKSEDVRLELEKFAEDAPSNLRSIKGKLGASSFSFAPAKGVRLPKTDAAGKKTGKFRPIVLAPVESRIVQRAILNVLLDIPSLMPYFKTAFSFGGIRSDRKGEKADKSRSEAVSAVPAAIGAVLKQIGRSSQYVASADIKSFFTRISKDAVTSIISSAVQDDELIALFRSAIEVELLNMAQLRESVADFPIEDIGVAQGNSLSPLLGNIVLADFDRLMNEGDCCCIRYIDDFIILAPSKGAANARLSKAKKLLAALGMELSPEKSSKGGTPVQSGFDFLGINICPGAVRPGAKAQAKLCGSVKCAFDESLKAMRGVNHGQPFERPYSFASTLKRVDGIVDGWGKHYWFCNDKQTFANLDQKLGKLIAAYIGEYAAIRVEVPESSYQRILGVAELKSIKRDPFVYPKLSE